MSSSPQRQALLLLINEACTAGARLQRACRQIGLTERTVQRWQRPETQDGDHRVADKRVAPSPANKLSAAERNDALALLNSDAFKDLPPRQTVPRPADQGQYMASESTLYRLFRAAGQMTHRHAVTGLSRTPCRRKWLALLRSCGC